MADISKITDLSGTVYNIKDATARSLATSKVGFVFCSGASNTPENVTWGNITGTLEPSDETMNRIYLVPYTYGNETIYTAYVTYRYFDGTRFNNYWRKIDTTDFEPVCKTTFAQISQVSIPANDTVTIDISSYQPNGYGLYDIGVQIKYGTKYYHLPWFNTSGGGALFVATMDNTEIVLQNNGASWGSLNTLYLTMTWHKNGS